MVIGVEEAVRLQAGLSGNLIMLAILYSDGHLVVLSELSVGQLSSFLLYTLYVSVSISGLSGFYTELMRGLGASSRLFHLIDRRPAIPLTGGRCIDILKGAVRFENVHFCYPTREDSSVLKGLDLDVPEGKVTALVGPSGSGKSTISALLLRFYDPQQGRILLDGHDLKTLDPTWIRRHIGTVPQEPMLFSTSIAENIAYRVEKATREEVLAAATQANAVEFIDKFPPRLDTLVGERGLMLSGGQRQRIAIARALLDNPKLLILDEATSALDAESEYLVRQALQKLLQGGQRTVLIIAHRLSTIRNADQIFVLSDGKIAEKGTYTELIKIQGGIFSELVNKQTTHYTTKLEDETF